MVDTGDRLRRLLAILAWLAQVGEAPIDEVAVRFDLSPQALVTELEMAACCGVPPYTPDQLMEIVVTETTVSTRVGTALARPRRLSPSEGFALAASARALLAVPGSDEEWCAVPGPGQARPCPGRGGGGRRARTRPPTSPLVKEALDSERHLAISYYSASTDRVTDREILPLRLFGSEGHWYVDAWCESAGGVRRFRVDRIGAASWSTAVRSRTCPVPVPPGARMTGPEAPGSSRSCPAPTPARCACRSSRPRPG